MSKPNIVLILADDMGYGDFGLFGDGTPETPTLDQLAAESICLTQHYSAAPVCTPARAGLLTGRYPHRTGAIDMRELRGLNRIALRERTIADLFKTAGYTTGLVGKWHTGTIGAAYHPNARGFDEFVGFRGGMSDYYDWRLYYNQAIHHSDGRYVTDVFAAEAVSFLERHQKDPFFLHVAFNAPHVPLQAPTDLIQHFRDKGAAEGPAIVYAMIYQMDKAIETILDKLRQLKLEKNTLVLFASDNGPQFGIQEGLLLDRYNAGLAKSKGSVFEGGIRVPGLIRWPEHWAGGKRLDDFVHFTDWLPTLLAAAGIEAPADLHLDGHNVLPLFTGESHQVTDKRFWQWCRYEPLVTCNAAMRDGAWKLIRPAIPEAMQPDQHDFDLDREVEKNPERYSDIIRTPLPKRTIPDPKPALLFHLQQDPEEQIDIAAQHPQRVNRMLSELDTWFASVEKDRRSIRD